MESRTNASYDRFWEGRKQWGAIVNESRKLGRAASVYLAGDPALARRVLAWASALSWATMRKLRGGRDLGEIAKRLPADEVRSVLSENHVPLAVGRRISTLVAEGRHGRKSGEGFYRWDGDKAVGPSPRAAELARKRPR